MNSENINGRCVNIYCVCIKRDRMNHRIKFIINNYNNNGKPYIVIRDKFIEFDENIDLSGMLKPAESKIISDVLINAKDEFKKCLDMKINEKKLRDILMNKFNGKYIFILKVILTEKYK